MLQQMVIFVRQEDLSHVTLKFLQQQQGFKGVLDLDQQESGAQGLRSKLTMTIAKARKFASNWKTAAKAMESKIDDLAKASESKDK